MLSLQFIGFLLFFREDFCCEPVTSSCTNKKSGETACFSSQMRATPSQMGGVLLKAHFAPRVRFSRGTDVRTCRVLCGGCVYEATLHPNTWDNWGDVTPTGSLPMLRNFLRRKRKLPTENVAALVTMEVTMEVTMGTKFSAGFLCSTVAPTCSPAVLARGFRVNSGAQSARKSENRIFRACRAGAALSVCAFRHQRRNIRKARSAMRRNLIFTSRSFFFHVNLPTRGTQQNRLRRHGRRWIHARKILFGPVSKRSLL